MNRRSFLELFGVAVPLVALAGCSGEGDPAGAPAASAPGGPAGSSPDGGGSGSGSDAWVIPPIALVIASGGTFDLATTLPTRSPRGGVFGVDPSGTALPNGMSLSKEGLLSVGSAVLGDVSGVIFSYEA